MIDDDVVNEILECGLADWVEIDVLADLCMRGEYSEAGIKQLHRILQKIYSDNLMIPGTLDDRVSGWHGTWKDWVQRSIEELSACSWRPQGSGHWLRLTQKGEELIRKQIKKESEIDVYLLTLHGRRIKFSQITASGLAIFIPPRIEDMEIEQMIDDHISITDDPCSPVNQIWWEFHVRPIGTHAALLQNLRSELWKVGIGSEVKYD
jgi:hypothetical protein